MYLSVVVPVFNEEKKILSDLQTLIQYFLAKNYPCEILIVNDGSQDETKKKAEYFAASIKHPLIKIRILDYGQNKGKGYAIKHGIEKAEGAFILFMDSGMCVPLSYSEIALEKLKSGFDYATASRRLAKSNIKIAQPLYRQMGSKVFLKVVRILMGLPSVTDTQCGFKMYTKEAAKKIFSRVTTNGFMFDVEALLIAKKLNLKGTEFPVEWSNDSDTRYHPILGTIKNFKELVKIKWNLTCQTL